MSREKKRHGISVREREEFQRYFEASEAWLRRGNWQKAEAAIGKIPVHCEILPEVYLLKCDIYLAAEEWDRVERLAEYAVGFYPERVAFYVYRAWAIHKQGHTKKALSLMTEAAKHFPQSDRAAYHLACLNGALGRISEAKRWLTTALDCAKEPVKLKVRAMEQPELYCLGKPGRPESP